MRTYIHFSSLDSTNRWAKTHAAELSPEGLTCITTDEQTAGYGTQGRPWVSPLGNLYATFFFFSPHAEQGLLSHLPQILSLSIATTLEKEGVFLQIKWPNDLLYNGKKCAGILAESFYVEKRLGVVLGFGLNVNTPVEGVDQPVTSLCEITGKLFDVKILLHAIVDQFEKNFYADFATLWPQIEARLLVEERSGMTMR